VKSYRALLAVASAAALPAGLASPPALALNAFSPHPVKGARYTGSAQGEAMSMKVSGDGKSVTVTIAAAPSFCRSGTGAGTRSSVRAAVNSYGGVATRLTFSSGGAKLATVSISGNFFTFRHSKPAFEGVLTTSFLAAGRRGCNGHHEFAVVDQAG
jgi:hypothetical protein